MPKTDNLKLTILIDGQPSYFGAPVFYDQKVTGDGEVLTIRTEVGNQVKQRIEIQIKNHTYVEPIVLDKQEATTNPEGDTPAQ